MLRNFWMHCRGMEAWDLPSSLPTITTTIWSHTPNRMPLAHPYTEGKGRPKGGLSPEAHQGISMEGAATLNCTPGSHVGRGMEFLAEMIHLPTDKVASCENLRPGFFIILSPSIPTGAGTLIHQCKFATNINVFCSCHLNLQCLCSYSISSLPQFLQTRTELWTRTNKPTCTKWLYICPVFSVPSGKHNVTQYTRSAASFLKPVAFDPHQLHGKVTKSQLVVKLCHLYLLQSCNSIK